MASVSSNQLVNKLAGVIQSRITTYLESKYPTTFPISGITAKELEVISHKIVSQSNNNKDKIEQGINNFLVIIERKLKTLVYSENRMDKVINTNKYNDPLTEISHKQFSSQNFNPSQTPEMATKQVNNNKIPEAGLDPTTATDYKKAYEETTLLANSGIEKPPDFYTPETRDFTYNIVIDSKDRDKNKYPNANYFVIDFSPPNFNPNDPGSTNAGFIGRAFGNIISCEILDIVMLHTSDLSDSSDSAAASPYIPYILIDLPELGTNYQGTNDELNKCFAMLTSYDVQDNYKHFHINADNSSHTIKKIYNPRINLNKLTVQIKLPNGELWDFGSVKEDKTPTLFKISLRIVCLQKNLATNYYSKAVY